MSRIRGLRRDDLPQVVALYRTHLAVPNLAGEEELRTAFEQVFLGEPLSAPDIPSLVFEGSGGEIVGFIGSLVRRMRFGDRSVRLACSSSLVVSPKARQIGAGGLLRRKYLAGPQDLTMTDTAGRATEQMWKRLGGSKYHLGSISWLHLIHPVRAAAGLKLWHLGRHQQLPLVRPLCRPLDAAYARSGGAVGTDDAEKLVEEPLTPQLLIDHYRLGSQQFRLWPDYDVESLGLLFDHIERSRSNGRLIRTFVRDVRGEPLGWYVASLLPSDIYRVLGLAATPGNEELLFRHVLRDARDVGAAAVAGRVEPWLLEAFPKRMMMFSRVRFLFHSRDNGICEAVQSGNALLTGLESDIWLPR